MAKKINSKFLIIEGTGNEFMSIGFGGGTVINHGTIDDMPFKGFAHISIEGGECIVCDRCNMGILPDAQCYFIAALNRIYCKDCFERWHKNAIFHPEDRAYEIKNYNKTEEMLLCAGIPIQIEE